MYIYLFNQPQPRFNRMQAISNVICDPSNPCNISRRFDAVAASWLMPFRISKTLSGNLVLVMKLRESRESSPKPDQDVLMRERTSTLTRTLYPPLVCVANGRGNLHRPTITVIHCQMREFALAQDCAKQNRNPQSVNTRAHASADAIKSKNLCTVKFEITLFLVFARERSFYDSVVRYERVAKRIWHFRGIIK